MSAVLTLITVTMPVPTLRDRSSAAAVMGTHSLLMEDHVWMLMSAQLAHITANNSVSTPMEDLCAAATQATSLPLMVIPVLVSCILYIDSCH